MKLWSPSAQVVVCDWSETLKKKLEEQVELFSAGEVRLQRQVVGKVVPKRSQGLHGSALKCQEFWRQDWAAPSKASRDRP